MKQLLKSFSGFSGASIVIVLVLSFIVSTSPVIADSESTFITKQELQNVSSADIEYYRDLFESHVPIICEGSGVDLMGILGKSVVESASSGDMELFAVYSKPDGVLKCASFSIADAFVQELRFDKATGQTEKITGPIEVIRSELDFEQDRIVLLAEAKEWTRKAVNSKEPSPSISMGSSGGAWNAYLDYEDIQVGRHSIQDGKRVVIFSLRSFCYKLPDLRYGKDFYLIESSLNHEANVDVNYQEGFALIGTSWTGWYVQDRRLQLQSVASSQTLLDYGPTGTISSSSVTISVGAGLSGSAVGPGAGIEVGFSKTFNYPDLVVTDISSIADDYAKWVEAFTCPKGDYSLWPFVSWPANTSKNTFTSEPVTIFSHNITDGSSASIKSMAGGTAYLDKIVGYVFWAEIWRYWYQFDIQRTLTILKNFPPYKPSDPSGPISGWVNQSLQYDFIGSDPDCQPLKFMVDWSDGSSLVQGGNLQSHIYMEGGNFGIRVKSVDQPQQAYSEWSGILPVFIKSISRIEIVGPGEIPDNGFGQYSCVAHFNDGNTIAASPTWSISYGSEYAEIDQTGLLTPKPSAQDHTVMVRAVYSDHGVEKVTEKSVMVKIQTATEENDFTQLPDKFGLSQNFPNPFNPTTSIRYALKSRSNVSLIVFNLMGQQVRTLVNKSQPAGEYSVTWDGTDFNGEHLVSGIYFYRFQTNKYSDTRRMILLK